MIWGHWCRGHYLNGHRKRVTAGESLWESLQGRTLGALLVSGCHYRGVPVGSTARWVLTYHEGVTVGVTAGAGPQGGRSFRS